MNGIPSRWWIYIIMGAVLVFGIANCFAQTLTAKRYSIPWTLAHCERASFGIVKPVAVFNVSTGDGQWEPTCR